MFIGQCDAFFLGLRPVDPLCASASAATMNTAAIAVVPAKATRRSGLGPNQRLGRRTLYGMQ